MPRRLPAHRAGTCTWPTLSRTRSSRAPPSERPTVTRILPDLNTRDLRFYDVDGDLRQDLIANLHGRVLALDGTTLDSLFSFGRAESVVLGQDRLFLKDQDSLHCYDFISGGFRWSRALDGYLGREPVLHAGRLYDVIGIREGERPSRVIIGVDAASGKTLWSRDLGPGHSASDIQMIVNDRAVILSMDHAVHGVLALDPVTGGILWKRERRLVSGPMSLDESRLYGHLDPSPVVGAIDLATGNLAWAFSYPPRRRSGPRGNLILLPDKVVTGNARWGLMALTKSDGLLAWARPSIRPWAMTAVGDMLHVAHGSGAVDSLAALSLNTGATRWQMPLTSRRPERIVHQSGRLLVDSGYGTAVIADSASFAEVGSREPPRARLAQNYPNPFNAGTTIRLQPCPEAARGAGDLQHSGAADPAARRRDPGPRAASGRVGRPRRRLEAGQQRCLPCQVAHRALVAKQEGGQAEVRW